MEGPTEDSKLRKLLATLVRSTKGDGFDTYTYINSEYGEIQPKVSYQRMITGWAWLIAAGVNITDISAAVEQDIATKISETLILILLVSFGIAVITVLIEMLASRSVTASIANISELRR